MDLLAFLWEDLKRVRLVFPQSTDFFLYCKYHFPAENEKNSNWNGVVKMDKEKLKAYGVDYENAVKRFAGNEALYEKFLKKLTEDDHLAIGEQAMKKEERYEDVLEAVHALKRGCRNPWNDGNCSSKASEVVASIRKNEISHLQEQMAKVHTEFEKACEAVS